MDGQWSRCGVKLIMSILGVLSSIVGGGEVVNNSGNYYGYQWYYRNSNVSGIIVPPVGNWQLYSWTGNVVNDNAPGEQAGSFYFPPGNTNYYITADLNSTGKFTGINDITIEIWFKPEINNCVLLSEQGSTTPNVGWTASVLEINSNNTISARLWNGTGVTSTQAVTLNSWNHVYLSYNGATQYIDLRVNNVEEGQVYYTGRNASSNYYSGGSVHFQIGATAVTNLGNSAKFQGTLGSLRIFNWCSPSNFYELSYKYLLQDNGIIVDANLKAHYDGLTAPSGFNWNDLSGNNYHLTLANTWSHNNVTGYYEFGLTGMAFTNAGSDHFGTNGQAPDTGTTITGWFYVTEANQFQFIVGFRNDNDYDNYLLIKHPGNNWPNYNIEYRVTTNLYTTNEINALEWKTENLFSRWVHVTLKTVSGFMWLYINGKFYSNNDVTGFWGNSLGELYIFQQSYPVVQGRCAGLQFYNRSLSEDEIRRNYCAIKNRLGL